MKDIIFDIDSAQCSRIANDIFIKDSGIDRPGRKFEKMREAAYQIRSLIGSDVKLRFACRYYDEINLTGKTLVIGGQSFVCNAFEQIESGAVEGVYAYAVCAGEFDMPDKKIMDQLYADIWGTAFADAVRFVVRQRLEEEAALSESFGPGFYGMDVSEISNLDKLLDFSRIGIELRNDTIMVPLKSCAGMFFKVNENYIPLNTACETCRGSHKSCRLCHVNGGSQYV